MNKLKKNPVTFKNQREAYWFRKGYEEAMQQMNNALSHELQRYSLEFLDHLPTGEEEQDKVVE